MNIMDTECKSPHHYLNIRAKFTEVDELPDSGKIYYIVKGDKDWAHGPFDIIVKDGKKFLRNSSGVELSINHFSTVKFIRMERVC